MGSEMCIRDSFWPGPTSTTRRKTVRRAITRPHSPQRPRYGMVWYGLNGAGRRPTHHLGSGRGQSPPGGPFLLPSGGPQIWGQSPRPARPALPLGTVAGSEFTGSPPPPTRTPSRKGALDSRPTSPSPRLPRGGSEGRPAICQFVVTPTATSAAPPLALHLWRLGTALGARAR